MSFMQHADRAEASRELSSATLGLALGLGMLSLHINGAMAQQPSMINLSDPYVTVDLSVIDDGGIGTGASLGIPGLGRRLLMPGAQMPVSKLHVALPKWRARRAADMPKETKVARRSAPAAAPMARKSPAPTQVATPAMAEPPPPSMKKAPKPKVKVAPLAPPPLQLMKEAPKPKVAKKTAKNPKAPSAQMGVALPPPPLPAMRTAKALKKEPEAKQKASLQPAAALLLPGQAMKIVFDASTTKLPSSARAGLKGVAAKMKGQDKMRMQLISYADSDGLSASQARRISLSRALAVRSYLIKNGVQSTRIDVRALGNKTSAAPANRVEIMVVER